MTAEPTSVILSEAKDLDANPMASPKSEVLRFAQDDRTGVDRLIAARAPLVEGLESGRRSEEAEGGCGVIGMACAERIAGRHMLQALKQMRNRGNGKGGGIAAVGLVPEQLDVSAEVLTRDYLLTIAFLDTSVREEVEREYVHATFEVDHTRYVEHIEDYRTLGLEVPPPEVYQYFVRVKPGVAESFRGENDLSDLSREAVEDEVVYQNSYRLNKAYYASTGDKRAFVLSHGKNMMVLKMVGYGEDVVGYYKLEDTGANVWIGHHRYPTKGRVWHPGGAHPFMGLHEALVHNGDFANYASISEYLAQRNIFPLFLTDTEVSVQVFDLLHRVYGYPLEYVIESLAPTTERDFTMLPPDKQRVYGMLQATHIHGSPDGPWFFLIAQSAPDGAARLIGITDTSMLRPQVFALQNGPVPIGFAASEKQAIDAALESLAAEDPRFWTHADRYWNARGGSHTDGGAFIFTIPPGGGLTTTDKFGRAIVVDSREPWHGRLARDPEPTRAGSPCHGGPARDPEPTRAGSPCHGGAAALLPEWTYDDVVGYLDSLVASAGDDAGREAAIATLTSLIDGRYPTGNLRPSSLRSMYAGALGEVFAAIKKSPSDGFAYVESGALLPEPANERQAVVVDARGFPPEGPDSLAMVVVALYHQGFRRFLLAHTRGHRFIANGLGPETHGVRIDVYGSSGDYLASGMDGAEVFVHGNAQDQLAQIMKDGKLVVHGDVGQTFMYAAKGGYAYVLGNAAGRPMINAVGKPRVVINGTCLDYLAESFMAGDPLSGGGFVILNGIAFDDNGGIVDLPSPYPGGNLFSLASGGAIYVRDPLGLVTDDQLNGGEFQPLTDADWAVILPCLEENERLFNIPLSRLLELDGHPAEPRQLYRKIRPRATQALQAEEAWVKQEA